MKRLEEYSKRYTDAMKESPYRRDFILVDIMTDMEREFEISALSERAAEEVDHEVLQFYRMVSDSRSI